MTRRTPGRYIVSPEDRVLTDVAKVGPCQTEIANLINTVGEHSSASLTAVRVLHICAHLQIAIRVHQNVAWFEISVEHTGGMDVAQPSKELVKQPLQGHHGHERLRSRGG